MQIYQQNSITQTMDSTNQNMGVQRKRALQQKIVRLTGLKQGLGVFHWLSSYLHCFF